MLGRRLLPLVWERRLEPLPFESRLPFELERRLLLALEKRLLCALNDVD